MTISVEQEQAIVEAAAKAVREHFSTIPSVALIIGSGLDGIIDGTEIIAELPLSSFEGFPQRPTIASHKGTIALARLDDNEILVLRGRYHYYEGYSLREVTLPIRLLQQLGIRTIVQTGACGTVAPYIRKNTLALVADHINLIGDNPLIGPNNNAWGERFPDMSDPYNSNLRTTIQSLALQHGIALPEAVYCAVAGPNFSTPAEYRFYRSIDADCIGMSIVPETIAARHAGIQVAAIVAVTDECYPDTLQPISYNQIISAATALAPQLQRLLKAILPEIS